MVMDNALLFQSGGKRGELGTMQQGMVWNYGWNTDNLQE